jgi:hypothetical protein
MPMTYRLGRSKAQRPVPVSRVDSVEERTGGASA